MASRGLMKPGISVGLAITDATHKNTPPDRRGMQNGSAKLSVLETLIGAPPPRISVGVAVRSDHFGAFNIVTGQGLCARHHGSRRPCRTRTFAHLRRRFNLCADRRR